MNSRLEKAIQIILDVLQDKDLPKQARVELLDAAKEILNGQSEYEAQLRELRELLLRNPAFLTI